MFCANVFLSCSLVCPGSSLRHGPSSSLCMREVRTLCGKAVNVFMMSGCDVTTCALLSMAGKKVLCSIGNI